MSISWSSWSSIDSPTRHPGPAVYRIRLVSNIVPISIARFLGTDSEGILSIGVSGNMENRRKAFIRGLTRGRGHSEANLLCIIRMYTRFLEVYPYYEIHLSFATIPNKEEAEAFEETLIKQYVVKFGEVPPLNSSIPNRYEWNSWENAAKRIGGSI